MFKRFLKWLGRYLYHYPKCTKCGGKMKCVGATYLSAQKIRWFECEDEECDGKKIGVSEFS